MQKTFQALVENCGMAILIVQCYIEVTKVKKLYRNNDVVTSYKRQIKLWS